MSTEQNPFNINSAEEAAPQRFASFDVRPTRIALYLCILAVVFVFTLRRVEHFLTTIPPLQTGPEWTLRRTRRSVINVLAISASTPGFECDGKKPTIDNRLLSRQTAAI